MADGMNRGAQYGGVSSLSQCNQLPASLQDGCKWRFNWAGGKHVLHSCYPNVVTDPGRVSGTVNGWTTTYNQVECPTELTSISRCSA